MTYQDKAAKLIHELKILSLPPDGIIFMGFLVKPDTDPEKLEKWIVSQFEISDILENSGREERRKIEGIEGH